MTLFSTIEQTAIGVVYLMRYLLQPYHQRHSLDCARIFRCFLCARTDNSTVYHFHSIPNRQVNKYGCVEKFSHNETHTHPFKHKEHTKISIFILAHVLEVLCKVKCRILRFFATLYIYCLFPFFLLSFPVHVCKYIACLVHQRYTVFYIRYECIYISKWVWI